jgi:hypothetical protein
MVKQKTTTEGMIKSIVWCCANRNIKSVQDISTDTGLDRMAVSRYTCLLSDIGVLIPHYKGKRVYYTVNPDIQRYLEREGCKWIDNIIQQDMSFIKNAKGYPRF